MLDFKVNTVNPSIPQPEARRMTKVSFEQYQTDNFSPFKVNIVNSLIFFEIFKYSNLCFSKKFNNDDKKS
jgi:hypothetical protein